MSLCRCLRNDRHGARTDESSVWVAAGIDDVAFEVGIDGLRLLQRRLDGEAVVVES